MNCGAVALGLGLGLSFKPSMLNILLSIRELSGVGCVLGSAARARWVVAKQATNTRTVVVAMVVYDRRAGNVVCMQEGVSSVVSPPAKISLSVGRCECPH